MEIKLDGDNPKQGVLGLVVALVEIIKETLELQSIKRMQSGKLNEDQIEKIGIALRDLNDAVEQIKIDCGIEESVSKIRDGLDNVVDNLLDELVAEERLDQIANCSSGHSQLLQRVGTETK